MKRPLPEILDDIDQMIRNSRGGEARAALKKLKEKKLPRPLAARFAALAWRADLPALGVRALNPVVRSDRKNPIVPSILERAEYAQCLIRLGAVEEASRLLDGLSSDACPQVLLYSASARISHWEYAQAIPLLSRYVKAAGLTRYQRIVGMTNLAAALVYERQHERATPLLHNLVYETSVKRMSLLFGVSLELSAQNFALQRKFGEMEKCLAKASESMQGSQIVDEFFVRKWKAIASALKNKAKAGKELAPIREEARSRKHWETLRQCDQIEAMATGDDELFLRVYFGTPFGAFRKRLVDDYGKPPELPREYSWALTPSKGGPSYDLLRGASVGKTEGLKPGQLQHRLLTALCLDFYRPIRLASLHFCLYPGEVYNPVSSPFRVYEAVKRLRQWLEACDLPLRVAEDDGAYSLEAVSPCRLILPGAEVVSHRHGPALERLREAFGEEAFSIHDACKLLELPLRTAHRLVKDSTDEGKLERVGRSRSTRYRFAS